MLAYYYQYEFIKKANDAKDRLAKTIRPSRNSYWFSEEEKQLWLATIRYMTFMTYTKSDEFSKK